MRAAPELLSKRASAANLAPTEELLDSLYMGAFSAGGSVLKRLLQNDWYLSRTAVLSLADAMYTSSWDEASSRTPPVIPGFIDYAVEAVSDPGKLLVSTVSPNPNGQWASGIENQQRLAREIESRTGQTFHKLTHLYGVEDASHPPSVYRLGNVILAEYSGDSRISHTAHAYLQPRIWQQIIIPWLEQGMGHITDDATLTTSSPSSGGGEHALPIILIALAAGLALRGRR